MGIFGLAWGYVLGAVLHLGVQLPAALRLPARRYFSSLGLHLPAVRQVFRLMGPRLLGVAVVQLNFVVNAIIASGQPVGSLTSIKYAWAIMTMPQVVIAQAIAIAALPTFSAQVAQGNLDDMRRSLASTLRGVILLSLPASFGLILLSTPLITVLFQRGEFTEQSTEMVTWALFWFSLGLLGHGLVEILARAYYALKDTLTPVLVGVAAMSLNVLFSFWFSTLFERWGWMPHGGLALANSLATALEMVGLVVLMRRRLKGLEGKRVVQGALQSLTATLVMCVGILGWIWITQGWAPWVVAVGGVLVGAGIYAIVIFGLGVEEGRWLFKVLRSRFNG
jgi:putative peptidoglycan lipid II flippase